MQIRLVDFEFYSKLSYENLQHLECQYNEKCLTHSLLILRTPLPNIFTAVITNMPIEPDTNMYSILSGIQSYFGE